MVLDDEPPDQPEELVGALRPRVPAEEPVLHPGELHVLLVLAPLHPPRVRRVPLPEHVALRGDDEHGGHLDGLQPRRLRPRRVDRRVVPGRAAGQREAAVLVAGFGGEVRARRALQLGARPGLAGHGRHEEDVPAEPDGGAEAGLAERGGDVVGDVAAGRVASDEDAGEVGGVGEPGVGGGSGAEPRHGLGAVLLGGGDAVLRREAVVEGEHHGGELGGEAEAAGVEAGPAAGADAEAAAVEVGHHRDPRVVGRAERPVEADVEAVLRLPRHSSAVISAATGGSALRRTVPSLISCITPRQSSTTYGSGAGDDIVILLFTLEA
uniref:Uncharacterized protein n=1 Tax=Setaria italica TaxID=4555 RepID=K3ZVA7_SETIT